MGMYQKAYESYCVACENYGMESMNIEQFIKNLTKEQLHEYLKHAIH
ncbi:hypothetical protein [Bacillus sp. B15-48]|nr:hypothetical protein [Bacillus sp. B15-48]